MNSQSPPVARKPDMTDQEILDVLHMMESRA